MKSEQIELIHMSPVPFQAQDKKDSEIKDVIAYLRRERGYTLMELWQFAGRGTVSYKTLKRWAAGQTSPEPAFARVVISEISDPTNPPSARMQKQVEESHHITWHAGKGYELRVVLDMGQKLVGKKIRRRLKTRNIDEAILRRDLIIESYCDLGLTVRNRKQKRAVR